MTTQSGTAGGSADMDPASRLREREGYTSGAYPQSGVPRPDEQADERGPEPEITTDYDETEDPDEAEDSQLANHMDRREAGKTILIGLGFILTASVYPAVKWANQRLNGTSPDGLEPTDESYQDPALTDSYDGPVPNVPTYEAQPLGNIHTSETYPYADPPYSAAWQEQLVEVAYPHLPGGDVSPQQAMNDALRAFGVMLTLTDGEFEHMLKAFVDTSAGADAAAAIRRLRDLIHPDSHASEDWWIIFDTIDNPCSVSLEDPSYAPVDVRGVPRGTRLLVQQATTSTYLRPLKAAFLARHPNEDPIALGAVPDDAWGLWDITFWIRPDDPNKPEGRGKFYKIMYTMIGFPHDRENTIIDEGYDAN